MDNIAQSCFGRREIFTDVAEITRDNVIKVVQDAIGIHALNAIAMNDLLNYEAGDQPLRRKTEKKYRKDIDVQCVDNIANEITEFKLDFQWAAPITFVQRDGADEEDNITDAVTELNACYDAEDIGLKTQELGRFIEITGVGYTYVDVNMDYEEGDSYFHVEVLDPRTTFIVRSNYYLDKRPVLAVTFRTDNEGRSYYTCFSKDARYELLNGTKLLNGTESPDTKKLLHWEGANGHRSGEENPLHKIPIIEWTRACDRMGCFERQISEMNNLNLLISDFTNDVEQNTQAIWHANDVDFPVTKTVKEDGTVETKVKHPESSEWVNTTTTQDGHEPYIKPLAIDYDYEGMLNNIMARRALILQKCNVPQRNDNSGGSTGVAMSDATGWSAAEQAAAKQQLIVEASKMKEVKVALAAAKLCPDLPADSPMKKLNHRKIKTNVTRQRDYELTVKSNALATLLSHGVNGLVAMRTINLFDDTAQAYAASKELIDKYQKSIFDPPETSSASTQTKNKPVGGAGEEAANADRTMSDYSDQEVNSSMIGG